MYSHIKITYKNTIGRADDVTITDAILSTRNCVSQVPQIMVGVEQNGVIARKF